MRYYQIKAPAGLSDYVQYFWIGEAAVTGGDHFSHLSVASCSPQLVFLHKGRFSEVTPAGKLRRSFTAGIQGPSKTHARFISYENVGIFGVELHPYAIPALFSIPATDLTNRYVDIGTLIGSKGQELEERICCARNDRERVKIASGFLGSLIKGPLKLPVVAAVRAIDRSGGKIGAGALPGNVLLSQRQLERLFKECVGFSPKQYARISRFEAALNKLRSQASFTDIALDTGYFDQAHFNHDFLEFTGLSPKDYLKAVAKLPV
jgi:AraC-like DNA-binding protein